MLQRYSRGSSEELRRPAVVVLDHLQVVYQQQTVLSDLSLTVYDGQAVAFVGEPGVGKTTLLACLQGLLPPAHGRIQLFGTELPPMSALSRRDLGVMPQVTGREKAYADRPIRSYAESFAWQYGLPMQSHAIVKHLRLYGLEPTLLLKQLTRLQRIQLSLAVSVIHDPSLVLLDEPLANLSAMEQDEARCYIQQLRRQGRTLLVTFAPPLAECDQSAYDLIIHLTRFRPGSDIRAGDV